MGNCVMLCYGGSRDEEEKRRMKKKNSISTNSKEVDVSFGSLRKPLSKIPNEIKEEDKSKVVRVKLVLTRGEVEKLLAMRSINDDPAEKMLQQYLSSELGRLADDRTNIGSIFDGKKCRSDVGVWRPVLESIPETV